jgi:hypothetical protein
VLIITIIKKKKGGEEEINNKAKVLKLKEGKNELKINYKQ